MIRMIRNSRSAALSLGIALLAAACSDNPVQPEEHHEPVRVVIKSGQLEMASAPALNGGNITGALTIKVGEESSHLTVVFVDKHGHVIETDDDEWLRVESSNETIAEFEQHEVGEFGGHIHGVAVGSATLTFKLMHGAVGSSSAHADFVSAPIPVTVTQ